MQGSDAGKAERRRKSLRQARVLERRLVNMMLGLVAFAASGLIAGAMLYGAGQAICRLDGFLLGPPAAPASSPFALKNACPWLLPQVEGR